MPRRSISTLNGRSPSLSTSLGPPHPPSTRRRYLEVQYLLQTKKALLNSWRHEKKLTEEEIGGASMTGSQKTAGTGSDSCGGDGDKQEKRRLETKRRLMNWQKQKEDERREEEVSSRTGHLAGSRLSSAGGEEESRGGEAASGERVAREAADQ
jgi:hypothetical protein